MAASRKPIMIHCGMGAAVSGWPLARAMPLAGQLVVVWRRCRPRTWRRMSKKGATPTAAYIYNALSANVGLAQVPEGGQEELPLVKSPVLRVPPELNIHRT